MKNLLLLASLVAPSLLFSQTEEIEKAYLNSLISEGKATTAEMAQMGKAWRDLLAEFGGYPTLPYNEQTGKIEFIQVMEFPGKSKAEILRRCEEWIAINYGSINSVLHYKNVESGKLIAKGYFDLPFEQGTLGGFWFIPSRYVYDAKCFHTVIFTAIEGKLKVEHRDLNFKYRTQGYSSGVSYVPSEEYELHVSTLYPVTMGDQKSWKSRLRTIQSVESRTKYSHEDIKRYIKNADDYDKF